MMNNQPVGKFTKVHTEICKGVAIILLLAHHLFYTKAAVPKTFLGRTFWYDFAILGKVCVPIFLILSGYGIYSSFSAKKRSVVGFYKHVAVNLYARFWPIFALSLIPLVCVGGGMKSVWPDVWRFAINFFGVQLLFGEWGYNPTWWFLSLIIVCYALFPLLWYGVRRFPVETGLALLALGLGPHHIWQQFICPFGVGCFMAAYNVFDQFDKWTRPRKMLLVLGAVILFCVVRLWNVKASGVEAGYAFLGDVAIAAGLTLICWYTVNASSLAGKALRLIGVHSMNIFLVHTFIFGIYLRDFSYSTKYPPLIMLQLLIVSLALSFAICPIQKLFKALLGKVLRE